MRKILILAILFYILVLLQTSFLVHFNIFGHVPNFILLLVVVLSISEPPTIFFKKVAGGENSGVWGAVFGGFFLDIFSSGPIGFQILIYMAISIFIKLILKKYLWINILKTKE